MNVVIVVTCCAVAYFLAYAIKRRIGGKFWKTVLACFAAWLITSAVAIPTAIFVGAGLQLNIGRIMGASIVSAYVLAVLGAMAAAKKNAVAPRARELQPHAPWKWGDKRGR